MLPLLRAVLGTQIDLITDLRGQGTTVALESGGLERIVLNLVMNARASSRRTPTMWGPVSLETLAATRTPPRRQRYEPPSAWRDQSS